MATIKAKRTSYGLVEVRDGSSVGWFVIYVNGEVKEQSKNLEFILRQFDKY
jgi:hypothetical protein